MEVAYTCTLFNAESLNLKRYGYSGFINQDRYFSCNIRFIRSNARFCGSGGGGRFSRFFIAATKHIQIGTEEVGVHAAYLYNRRKDYKLNGPALGVTYSPSFHKPLTVIAEYDSKDFSMGATYLLLNHLHMQFEMQRMKWFSGGLAFKIYLK